MVLCSLTTYSYIAVVVDAALSLPGTVLLLVRSASVTDKRVNQPLCLLDSSVEPSRVNGKRYDVLKMFME